MRARELHDLQQNGDGSGQAQVLAAGHKTCTTRQPSLVALFVSGAQGPPPQPMYAPRINDPTCDGFARRKTRLRLANLQSAKAQAVAGNRVMRA
jgi:hypothetical protein